MNKNNYNRPSIYFPSLILVIILFFTLGNLNKGMANIEPDPSEYEQRYLEYCIPEYEYTCVKKGMLGVECLWKGGGCNY